VATQTKDEILHCGASITSRASTSARKLSLLLMMIVLRSMIVFDIFFQSRIYSSPFKKTIYNTAAGQPGTRQAGTGNRIERQSSLQPGIVACARVRQPLEIYFFEKGSNMASSFQAYSILEAAASAISLPCKFEMRDIAMSVPALTPADVTTPDPFRYG